MSLGNVQVAGTTDPLSQLLALVQDPQAFAARKAELDAVGADAQTKLDALAKAESAAATAHKTRLAELHTAEVSARTSAQDAERRVGAANAQLDGRTRSLDTKERDLEIAENLLRVRENAVKVSEAALASLAGRTRELDLREEGLAAQHEAMAARSAELDLIEEQLRIRRTALDIFLSDVRVKAGELK